MPLNQPEDFAVHDVVQIVPNDPVKPVYWGKLAIVDEVRDWGIVARLEQLVGDIYLRLPWGHFVRVGQLTYLHELSNAE